MATAFNPPLDGILLVVADLDDTLAPRDEDYLYPHVAQWLSRLKLHLAIATNRGGPPCHDAGWPWSAKFPTFEEDEERLSEIKKQLPEGTLLLTAYSYLTRRGKDRIKEAKQNGEDLGAVYKQLADEKQFLVPNALSSSDPRCDPFRRKPHGGMILEAMKHFGVDNPRHVLMIGDSDDDAGAAAEVGCQFHRVKKGVSIR